MSWFTEKQRESLMTGLTIVLLALMGWVVCTLRRVSNDTAEVKEIVKKTLSPD